MPSESAKRRQDRIARLEKELARFRKALADLNLVAYGDAAPCLCNGCVEVTSVRDRVDRLLREA